MLGEVTGPESARFCMKVDERHSRKCSFCPCPHLANELTWGFLAKADQINLAGNAFCQLSCKIGAYNKCCIVVRMPFVNFLAAKELSGAGSTRVKAVRSKARLLAPRQAGQIASCVSNPPAPRHVRSFQARPVFHICAAHLLGDGVSFEDATHSGGGRISQGGAAGELVKGRCLTHR